jgi:hypothetical protein
VNEARLLERLRADLGGDPAIVAVTDTSRHTRIYRVRTQTMALVCKAERGTRKSMLEAEFRKLVELQQRLAGSGLRSLEPVAVYPELGVLVTREEPGETVRAYIDRGIASAALRGEAEALMAPCAEVLFGFHRLFGQSYTDFHPGNLLVTPRGLVMMDPPPLERDRTPQWDLGLFCFGIARAGFAPLAIARSPQRWLDELKAGFVAAYFGRLGRAVTRDDLEAIRASERARGRRAMRSYARFRRFPNWPLELVRMAWFCPVIAAYLAWRLPRSYAGLEAGS